MFAIIPSHVLPSFSEAPSQDIECEGWLLKRRRRKDQGFAKRYFVLRESGVLSYAIHPQWTPRGQLDLRTATISSNTVRREIHIDCESDIYHVKATSPGDFEMWMGAFRKFIRISSERGTLGKKLSLLRASALSTDSEIKEIATILEDMGSTIKALDAAVRGPKDNEHNGGRDIHNKVKKENKGRKGLKGIFRKSVISHSPLASISDPRNISDASHNSSSFVHLIGFVEILNTQFDNLCKALMHPEKGPATFQITPAVGSPPASLSVDVDQQEHKTPREASISGNGDAAISYDPPEGPEEFVLVDDATQASEELEHSDGGSDSEAVSTADLKGEEKDSERNGSEHTVHASDDVEVVRRKVLPAPSDGDEGSLFALLRKNIGKDLTTVTFPVTFNEPLGLLQRLAEDTEYADLLTQACASHDLTERMCLVTAFAVSGFACTRLRSGRKPFNPMLGETFEDARTKFIAEKMSHHPVVVAFHAEGDGWELWGTFTGKNHFWGKSLEIEQVGMTHLRMGNDYFQWQKPSSFVRNLVVGKKYLEHVGSLSIENKTTGARCVVDFKEANMWGTRNVVSGTVYSPGGKIETRLDGTWHEQLSQAVSRSHLRVLWRANPFPEHAPQYYGLTSFATTLNEITSDIEGKLPPTDTRYRPDLRALEEGNIALAETEKARVENAQRERRSNGTEAEPKWFKQVGPYEYVYTGGYWEQRARGWSGYPHLW